METYKVARSSIEKAIAELVGEGYLYAKDGSGTYMAAAPAENDLEKNEKWGVILPNIVSDTYPEILRGIEDFAHINGISTIICNTDHDVAKQNRYIRSLVNIGVKGVVIVPAISDKSQTESLNLLKASNIPFVFCNRNVPGMKAPQVIPNNFYGISMITKHLIRLGCKKIAFVSGMYYIAVEQRYQAYLSSLAENGIPIRDDYIYIGVEEHQTEENGYLGAMKLLQSEDRPEAIVCFNDTVAIGAYRAANELGLTIGKDVAITGYDDTKICEQLPVQLTTVKFPKYEVGKAAAELLHNMVLGEAVRQDITIILQPEIIIRQSCGAQNSASK
jgi:DNA-binding LacI/PurR family transcriptional regulator